MRSIFGRVVLLTTVCSVAVALSGCGSTSAEKPRDVSVVESSTATPTIKLSAPLLPTSPLSGSIESYADEGALYSVELSAGEALGARILTSQSSAMGLLLYSPDATSVEQHEKVLAGFEADRYPSYLIGESGSTFVATSTGTYFLRVLNTGAPEAFTIEWAMGAVPTIEVSVSPTRPEAGKKSRVSGVVRGIDAEPLDGERLELWAAPTPDRFITQKVDETTVDADGAFSFTVRPDRRTRYEVVALGDVAGYAMTRSKQMTVIPKSK